MIKCSECGRSAREPGVILVRTSPKGVTPAKWKCEPCAGRLAGEVAQIVEDAATDRQGQKP